jgi:pimeloyl-ACP methyl ester carboxylesterase
MSIHPPSPSVGSSYGGYLAAILATLRPVKWLALRVPALYIDSGWELPKLQLHKEQDLRAYRRSFVPADSNRALRACAAFEATC